MKISPWLTPSRPTPERDAEVQVAEPTSLSVAPKRWIRRGTERVFRARNMFHWNPDRGSALVSVDSLMAYG